MVPTWSVSHHFFARPRFLKAMDDVAAIKSTEVLNNLRGVSFSTSMYGATTVLMTIVKLVNGAMRNSGPSRICISIPQT